MGNRSDTSLSHGYKLTLVYAIRLLHANLSTIHTILDTNYYHNDKTWLLNRPHTGQNDHKDLQLSLCEWTRL